MPTTTVKQTRTEVVFDAIRDEVLSVRIPPGTKMKLADYSQRFDVSLAVVREAMGRLAEQGLLQANPQRGFSTLPLSVGDLFELTRARIVIETATLRESITNGDLAWEGSVVAAHHQLAATAMYDESGTINRDFALVHRDFHVALLAGAANSHLESIATSLRDRSELYQYWSRYLGDGPNRDVACEHRQLAELTVARKVDEAADALARHIQRTTDSLVEYARSHESGA
ncbi:GntR family transcriptional regulator [Rhodococcus koreensis]|uniref:GntR family transcriptional regulator n=1 Tax=Rhodococcus koreensis TaxID=99653 RepID=UPI001F128AB1|nr:GntR family transcriptional regulator [Rhodococcus koreensis]